MSLKYDYEQSILTSPTSGLNYVMYPRTIAVIGATDRPGSVGATVMTNLKAGNKGNFIVFPVNPKRETIMGMQCYKNVLEISMPVELVIVILPAKAVPGCMEICGQKGVKASIIISAGFKEVGEEGARLENEVIDIARKYHIRVVGPNCLGVMTPNYGMNATFAARMALEGNVAFISQSGAMCTAALDWAIQQKVGFSAFISIGSMADVQWSDLLNFLADDNSTKAILMYMETIGDGRDFLSAARAVTTRKPVIVIKAGKSQAAAEAAASHTGSLAGSHDSYLAAMRSCGVLTVDSIRELFDAAVVVQKQPMPKGNRLTIITNAGGPGVLATDATSVNGGEIAELSEETIGELNKFLPPAWSHGNPVDILGDADASLYVKTMEVALSDPNSDGVLIILSPQSVTEPLKTAEAVVEVVNRMKGEGLLNKPVICSWMGGTDVKDGFVYLNENGVPCIDSPDDAARTFTQLYRNHKFLELASEQSFYDIAEDKTVDVDAAIQILKDAQIAGVETLSEFDAKRFLKHFGIRVTEDILCHSSEEAAAASKVVGFPCVAKLQSDTITHKSDVGGVQLRLESAEAVAAAYERIKENCSKYASASDFQGVSVQPMIDINSGIELLVGSLVDPQFGPLVVFGTGGCAVEIYQDTSTAIPPLSPNGARECINATKVSVALHGTGTQRFPGVDMTALVQTLVNFSNMLPEVTPYLTEVEINPLLALKDRVIALDARVMIRPKGEGLDGIPRVLIRPYPRHYHYKMTIKNVDVTVRFLNVYDAEALKKFLVDLDDGAFQQRFFKKDKNTVMGEIMNLCNCDYDTTFPLAMFNAEDQIMGVCRGFRLRGQNDIMEFKVVSGPKFRSIGVASGLIEMMKKVGQSEGVKKVVCVVTVNNEKAIKLLEKHGFTSESSFSNPNVRDDDREFSDLKEFSVSL